MSSVWPSGGARTTASVPILLPAPGRSSMTNGWPRRSDSHCPIRRATVSDVPPAANGDEMHRPRWIGLRPSGTRDGRQRGRAGGEMQKISAGKFHSEPPFTSFDHLIGAKQDPRRDRHTECFSGLEIDYRFECGRLLYRQISRLFALENAPCVDGELTIGGAQARSVTHQAAGHGEFTPSEDRRDGMARGEQHELIAP